MVGALGSWPWTRKAREKWEKRDEEGEEGSKQATKCQPESRGDSDWFAGFRTRVLGRRI